MTFQGENLPNWGATEETLRQAERNRERILSAMEELPTGQRDKIKHDVAAMIEHFMTDPLGQIAWGLLTAEFIVAQQKMLLRHTEDPVSVVAKIIAQAKKGPR